MSKSFTLIEILVVIVVIGVLSAFILVGMSSISSKANIAKGQAFENSLRNLLLMSLVAEYKLNGTVTDSFGVAPSGTLNGPPSTSTDCVSGTCYSFDGDDHIGFGDSDIFSFTNNIFTFSFWMKKTSSGNMAVLGKTLGAGSPYEYGIYGTGTTLNFYSWISSGAADVYTANNVTNIDTNWNFFVWTADGTNSYVYRNGVAGSPVAKTVNSLSNTTGVFSIGRGCNASLCYFHSGFIDEVRIYNASITSSEINEMYYVGLNKLYKNNGIASIEFENKLSELKFNLAND
jgi:prepilin-type N-terminal cleavage/methylation domain-containing protein